MDKQLTKEQIEELEKQLSCPSGEMGTEVGKNMNESNIGMTLNTIEFLELQNGHQVLELGHGNCGHLDEVLNAGKYMKYFGLEISETMMHEAKNNNQNQEAEFNLYDGINIPFPDNSFNRTFSVNTIYFWANREKLMQEIERTLKPGGICILTYANKDFMKNLPFVGEKFRLYDPKDLEELVSITDLQMIQTLQKEEQVKSKAGEPVLRTYSMTKLRKP
ncbi:class I SAM-dependent methyltransferase [Fulvivirga sediminis]|uniref:Class I SAM-dependent methyltransferase n=1 Tax=Fulvivirga sediminis TaxID=2803949 RepID=A0A937F6I0_9BACT|nr:class I SAM-dependent methyltransferase [Fulvivirga sediminis]MBL3655159.1 class I SAM-dependent methyltransferase [Fulvivirga sediminis]